MDGTQQAERRGVVVDFLVNNRLVGSTSNGESSSPILGLGICLLTAHQSNAFGSLPVRGCASLWFRKIELRNTTSTLPPEGSATRPMPRKSPITKAEC